MVQIGVTNSKYQGFMTFFSKFAMYNCMGGIMYYGSYLHQNGMISVGNITTFLLYMLQLVINLSIVAFVLGNIFRMFGAAEKIVGYMRYVPGINTTGGGSIPEF